MFAELYGHTTGCCRAARSEEGGVADGSRGGLKDRLEGTIHLYQEKMHAKNKIRRL